MLQRGSRRGRLSSLVILAGLALAGCTGANSIFAPDHDPRLASKEPFPNINVAGDAPGGSLLTKDEQAKATAALEAKGARISNPKATAATLKEQAAEGAALEKTAATHGKATLSEIENHCNDKKRADATKCPQ